jgi:hypothetical protein
MWVMAASPLLTSNDPRNMSRETKELLTNAEVLAIHKDPLAKMAVRIDVGGGVEASGADGQSAIDPTKDWHAYGRLLADNSSAVMLLNRGNTSQSLPLLMEDVGDSLHTTYSVRDVWQGADVGQVVGAMKLTVPAHGVRLLRLTPLAPAPPPHCLPGFTAKTPSGFWRNTGPADYENNTVAECTAKCETTISCMALEVYQPGFGACYNFLDSLELPFTLINADSITCVKNNRGELPLRGSSTENGPL